MGKIDLRPRLIGSGYVGTLDVGRAGSGPTLSWADSQALQSLATSGQAIADSVASAIGWMGAEVAGAIADLERELGLRLSEQTRVLGSQLEALERIEAALRHPATVRAAERLVDAGKLLDQRRFDRALPLAEEAMLDDPLNAAAFGAAAWALLGLGRLDDAHDHFAEAAIAAEGTERASYVRRQARVAFALGRDQEAEQALRTAVADESTSASERAACCYDLAIYVAPHDPVEAAEGLRHAMSHDSRYAIWALIDPLIREHPGLVETALSTIASLRKEMEAATGLLQEAIRTAEQRVAEPIDLILSTRGELEGVLTEARAFVERQEAGDPMLAQFSEIRRKPPLQRQLSEVRRMTEMLATAIASHDEQARAVTRIRQLMAVVQALQRDLAGRRNELDRLDRQLYEEYRAAAAYTQGLTNSLHKYRGRKYNKKIRERDEASARHMALMHQ